MKTRNLLFLIITTIIFSVFTVFISSCEDEGEVGSGLPPDEYNVFFACEDPDYPMYCENHGICCASEFGYTNGEACYSSLAACQNAGGDCETCYDENGNTSGGDSGGSNENNSTHCPGGLYCGPISGKCCPYGYFIYASGYCHSSYGNSGDVIWIKGCYTSKEAAKSQCHPNSNKQIRFYNCSQE